MNATVNLQVVSEVKDIPTIFQFRRWVSEALAKDRPEATEVTVRIVDEEESSHLNEHYRSKKKPTNVLSFPADLPPEVPVPLLGDIVICAGLVALEAKEQNIPLEAHWAHLTIHGTLHLLGYDHIHDADAKKMETLETAVLKRLGFHNPYQN